MIFNDFGFLFLFLPLTLAGFLLGPSRLRESLLLGASLIFYGMAGTEHVLLLLGCMAWVWSFTVSPAILRSRWRLAAAMIGPLVMLFYYKYLGFFVRDILPASLLSSFRFEIADKLLPAGISFFTFHLVAFAFDRYHGAIARQPPLPHFMLYIAFFPHLVAGPILRYHEVAPALAALGRFRPARSDWHRAITHFCCGLAAKVLLADGISTFIRPLASAVETLSRLQAAYVIFGYSFQIYFDFWGYSLMAMGLAYLFGFSFPENFNRPYSSLNPRDFWRRWHITLGRWFRDYLYIPMGGNRAHVRNILVVFMVCGLWHGAAWQFIAWGAYHGGLVVGYHLTQRWWDRCPHLAQQATTFLLVSLGWVLFQFDFSTAWRFLLSLAGQGQGSAPTLGLDAWAMMAVTFAACFLIDEKRLTAIRLDNSVRNIATTAGFAFSLVLCLLMMDRSDSFIYFRF